MRTIVAGLLLLILSVCPAVAVPSGAQRVDRPAKLIGCWGLVQADKYPSYSLCFHGASVSALYLGHQSPTAFEGLESQGRVKITRGLIVLHTDELAEGWRWPWRDVRCRAEIVDTQLHLTRCRGSGKAVDDQFAGKPSRRLPDSVYARMKDQQ